MSRRTDPYKGCRIHSPSNSTNGTADQLKNEALNIRHIITIRHLCVFLLVALFSLEGYWIAIKKYESRGNEPIKFDQLLPLRLHRAVGQTFTAQKDYLSRISLLLVVPEQAKGIPIEFHLQGVGRYGREYVLERLKVQQSGWMDFRFPPISDSCGYNLHFYIVALEESTAPLQVALSTSDMYSEGHVYGTGSASYDKRADLCFEFFYSGTIYQKLDEIVAGKPSLFGNKMFLVVVFILYNVSVALLFLRISIRPH